MKKVSLEEYKNGINFFKTLFASETLSQEVKKILLEEVFNMPVECQNDEELIEFTNKRNELLELASILDDNHTR